MATIESLSHARPFEHLVLDFLAYLEFERGLSRNTLEAYRSDLFQFGRFLEARGADAVTATKSLDNSKLISYLHSGVTLQTVQGPAKFDSVGMNTAASIFIFQWQTGGKFVQVLPTGMTGSVAVVNPKPAWGKG